ncbi:winged helix DNA-binding domain-containing protein [Methanocella sp. MCL-LM]|uniref:winged helix DNA-binding domain-containing protein n=1 Tax=Methanocella sp. MCL-LM TaxID=3412035 RepID=UPI003C735B8C
MTELSADQVRAMRLRAQYLHPGVTPDNMLQVVRALCGVNAQLKPAMLLSLRARARGFRPGHLAGQRQELVRTWAMRGTLHLLSRDDLGWILPLISPRLTARTRRRRLELGLDEEKLKRGLREMHAVLAQEGPLTRGELADRLIGRGVDIERKSQALYHLLAYAGLKGLIVMEPDRPDGEETYSLSKTTGKALSREQALAMLAGRYLEGYGPASAADFAAWSGLTMADAKTGWELLRAEGSLADVTVDKRVLGALEQQLKSATYDDSTDLIVNLLPAFDTLVLGYSDRSLVVPQKYQAEVYHGGQTVPVVLVNGAAAGVWRYERQSRSIRIEVHPFGRLDMKTKDLIEEEAGDVGRLFELAATVKYASGG